MIEFSKPNLLVLFFSLLSYFSIPVAWSQNLIQRIDIAETIDGLPISIRQHIETRYISSDTIKGYEIKYFVKNLGFGTKTDIHGENYNCPYSTELFYTNSIPKEFNSIYDYPNCKGQLYYVHVNYYGDIDPRQYATNRSHPDTIDNSAYSANFKFPPNFNYIQLNDTEIVEIYSVKLVMDKYLSISKYSKRMFLPLLYQCDGSSDTILYYNKLLSRTEVKSGSYFGREIMHSNEIKKDRSDLYGNIFFGQGYDAIEKKVMKN